MKKNELQFYFNADVVEPLVLYVRELRTEAEYDADVNPDKTALKYIKKVAECFDGNVYLLLASQDVVSPSKLRTKKWILWHEKEFGMLDSYTSEIDVGNGKTRLVSLVNLDGFSYDSSESIILNWIFGLVILTTLDISVLNEHIKGWVSKKDRSVLAFNYSAIAKDLSSLDKVAILRYFPADNGRNEMLVVVGNKDFVDEKILSCVE